MQFLSTPSARRATGRSDGQKVHPRISIHALREEGDTLAVASMLDNMISIHALREEDDVPLTASSRSLLYFYPRPPRGGRLKLESEAE